MNLPIQLIKAINGMLEMFEQDANTNLMLIWFSEKEQKKRAKNLKKELNKSLLKFKK